MTETDGDFYGGDPGDYQGDFADYGDPADFADQGGDGSYALPDDHWAHEQGWVEFVDGLVSALRSDPKMYQSFEAWLHSREAGEPERKFTGLHDPELRDFAKEHLRREREQLREQGL